MSPTIREAKADDSVAISALMTELGYTLSPEGVASRISAYGEPASRVWVSQIANQVVGFLSFHAIPLFHTPENLGRITAMAVSSSYRRHGIGRSLLATAEASAWDMGCVRIEVTSGDHRESSAHQFYEKHEYLYDCRRFLKKKP